MSAVDRDVRREKWRIGQQVVLLLLLGLGVAYTLGRLGSGPDDDALLPTLKQAFYLLIGLLGLFAIAADLRDRFRRLSALEAGEAVEPDSLDTGTSVDGAAAWRTVDIDGVDYMLMAGARGVPVRSREVAGGSPGGLVIALLWNAGAKAFAKRNVVKVGRIGRLRYHGIGRPFYFPRETDLQTCLDEVEARLRADPSLLVPAS